MAALQAELEVDGQTYPILSCRYSFTQATDESGRVTGKVRPGLLSLVLDVPESDQLLVWASVAHRPLDGHISFFDATASMAHETVLFTAGECVGYTEQFRVGDAGIGSYQCHLTIAAASLTLQAGGPVVRFVMPAAGEHGQPGAAQQPGRPKAGAKVLSTAAKQGPKLAHSVKEIVAYGQKSSTTFTSLLGLAKITEANCGEMISLSTMTHTEIGQAANIVLTKDPNIKAQVVGLTHELTNRINMPAILRAEQKVQEGLITPQAYAKQLAQIEINGQINQVKVAAATGYRYPGKEYKDLNKLVGAYSKNKKIDLSKKVVMSTVHLQTYEKQGAAVRADYLEKHPAPKKKAAPNKKAAPKK